MALTKVTTNAITDDAITSDKVADGAITAADVADGTLTLAKLSATGTKDATTFLRGDNSFVAVVTDLVNDTTPQLGGNLDLNSNDITGTGNINITGNLTSTGIDDNATSTAMTIDSSENVGIGETTPLGKLHVKSADSGGTPNSQYDELVLEQNGNNCGMTILCNSPGDGAIYFGDSADNDIGGIAYSHFDNKMFFKVNASERMRIDSSGAMLLGTTTAGSASAGDLVVNGGVFLGGTASANHLDDYEEGTWTPTTNIGFANIYYAFYVKIGRLVFVHMYVQTNAGPGDTSQATSVSGLPFAGKSGDVVSNNNIIQGLNQDVYSEVGGTSFSQRDRSDNVLITRGEYGSKYQKVSITYYTDA